MTHSNDYTKAPMRLSHSTLALVHGCPRKYQLIKLTDLPPEEAERIELDSNKNRDALDFGFAYGVAAQHYFCTGNKDEALMWALATYNFVETQTKNLASLLMAVDSLYIPEGWKVVNITNQAGITKPATELSFKLVLNRDTGDYYCGYVDLVLECNGTYFPLDFKTTGINSADLLPLYLNSGQVNGYGCVLDSLFPGLTSYDIVYDVAQLFSATNIKRHIIPINKTPNDKLEWIIDLQLQYEELAKYHELGFFPKRGAHCLSYNRTCSYFKICDMQSLQEQLTIKPIKTEEAWDFILYLDDLIAYATEQVRDYKPSEHSESKFISVHKQSAMTEILL